jgi:TIR domain
MPGVFISYRRQDSAKDARMLFEHLQGKFGAGEVFMDVEGLELGQDFVVSLEQQLERCVMLLALIGPGWLEARTPAGARRIDDGNDFVRIEIRTALQRNIRVVPVLLDGTGMPTEDQLPDDLKLLVRRQALELNVARFGTEVTRLVDTIRLLRAGTAAPVPPDERPDRVDAGSDVAVVAPNASPAPAARPRAPRAPRPSQAVTAAATGEPTAPSKPWWSTTWARIGFIVVILLILDGYGFFD